MSQGKIGYSNVAALLGNTGKQRGFAYITVPEHAVKELLKLYGIEFNGRKLVIKKAKTPPKKPTGKNKQACPKSQPPAIDLEMETVSIPEGMNIKSINKQVKGGRKVKLNKQVKGGLRVEYKQAS